MYLQDADSLEDVMLFGILPMLEHLETLHTEYLENGELDTRGQVYLYETKGKAFGIKKAVERMIQAKENRKRLEKEPVKEM